MNSSPVKRGARGGEKQIQHHEFERADDREMRSGRPPGCVVDVGSELERPDCAQRIQNERHDRAVVEQIGYSLQAAAAPMKALSESVRSKPVPKAEAGALSERGF